MQTATKSYDEIRLHNESVVVTTGASQYNWNYYLVQPTSLVFNDLVKYQYTYSLIIILTCAFCLLMIFLLSKRNVKPIIKINTQLKDSLL